MERSMLAAEAERVVAKGEMTDEEKEQARRDAQAQAANPDEELVEDRGKPQKVCFLKSDHIRSTYSLIMFDITSNNRYDFINMLWTQI